MSLTNEQTVSKFNPSLIDKDETYYGHGKIMLTGEYFVLDGAQSIGLPTKFGQSLFVKYNSSYNPTLKWKCIDANGEVWMNCELEFWHFNLIGRKTDDIVPEEVVALQNILRQARRQNKHFLRDEQDVTVVCQLEFPRVWGLGSSSSLIYSIAQWAYISPFELLFNTLGGSGHDVACAQSLGPIRYSLSETGPSWSLVAFDPPFKKNLFFVYSGNKASSRDAVKYYRSLQINKSDIVNKINEISEKMISATTLVEFESLIEQHEDLVSNALSIPKVKDLYFKNFQGAVKSLGAWGGDFLLVTSVKNIEQTTLELKEYGFDVVIPYNQMILKQDDAMQGFDYVSQRVH